MGHNFQLKTIAIDTILYRKSVTVSTKSNRAFLRAFFAYLEIIAYLSASKDYYY